MKMIDKNRKAINGIFQKVSETPASKDYYEEIKSKLDGGQVRYTYGDIDDGENHFHWKVQLWSTNDEPEKAVHLTKVQYSGEVGDGHLCWEIDGS